MKLTKQEFKLKKKLQILIDFSIDCNRTSYLKRRNHAPGRKLRVSSFRDNISLFFGTRLLTLVHGTFENSGVLINKVWFEKKEYDSDELFNLSTLHTNETITLLKLYISLDCKGYLLGLDALDYQLICDACNSIPTQYNKFERSNYA